jgi:hypothetical protein
MKYFAPPILAVLLMGWPTMDSLFKLLKGDSGGAGAGAGVSSLDAAKKTAAEELAKIQKTRKDLDALASVTAKPYGAGASPKLSPNSEFAPGWEGYSGIRDNLGNGLLQAISGSGTGAFPNGVTSRYV